MYYGIKDVPWHTTFPDKMKDKNRRDKRRCCYYDRDNNKCLLKKERCTSSSHCLVYSEENIKEQIESKMYRIIYAKYNDFKNKSKKFKNVKRKSVGDIMVGCSIMINELGTGTVEAADEKNSIITIRLENKLLTFKYIDGYLRKIVNNEKKF